MAVITLTTDFGLKDPSVGSVKGAILGLMPEVNVVDITHSISPFNIPEAAYVIKGAYKSFPQGTVHIIGVDSELSPENKHIALSLDGHFFVCANNGIMSMLSNHIAPRKIVEINIHQQLHTSFPVLDVFVAAACHIARGGTLDVIGKSISALKELKGIQPVVNLERNQIIGTVIYIDNYGNVVINIQRQLFQEVAKGRQPVIAVRKFRIKNIYERYSDAINFDVPKDRREEAGKELAIWNSSGFLELAIYKSNPTSVGSASSLFGLEYRDSITVSF